MKANQHLRRGLSTDATIEVGPAGEKTAKARLVPVVSDRVAHENHARLVLSSRRDRFVSVTIVRQRRPVFQPGFQSVYLRLRGGAIRRGRRLRRDWNQADKQQAATK